MPDRIIRDELLRSHRYRTLSSDTVRLLFIHLLLIVDSFGNTEANTITVADALHRPIDDVTGSKLLSELADADLVRLYSIDAKKYLHIPRLRQRLRYLSSKHPRPPPNIECKEIKELVAKVRLSQGEDRTKTLEVKRSEEKKYTGSGSYTDVARAAKSKPGLKNPEPQKSKLSRSGEHWDDNNQTLEAKAKALNLKPLAGETYPQLRQRVKEELSRIDQLAKLKALQSGNDK